MENILRQLLDLSRPVDIELGFGGRAGARAGMRRSGGAKDRGETSENNSALRSPPLTPCKLYFAKKLQQALLNLILNAIEVTGEGSRIRVCSQRQFVSTKINIWNSASETAALGLIQLTFHVCLICLHDQGSGSGLGLANAKRIVEAHEGNVEYGALTRTGSDFCHEVAMESMNRVLVIDDDASIRESLKMHLQDKGLAVHTADTGMAALELALTTSLKLSFWTFDYRTVQALRYFDALWRPARI